MKALRASNSFYAVRSLLTSTIYERGRLRGYSVWNDVPDTREEWER